MKALLATLIALVAAVVTALQGDDVISTGDYIAIGLFILSSGGVTWLVSKWYAGKAVVAAIGAFLTSLTTAVLPIGADSAITTFEWLVAILAGLTALGAIYQVPNTNETPDPNAPPG